MMPDDLSNRPEIPPAAPRRIAVVGAGVSGLTAAYLLSRVHRVTLYEKDPRLGGHANTVGVDTADGVIGVDTGFIVYNETNYPQLKALFRHLDVPTQPSDMSFAVSLDDGALEYSGSGLDGLFAQRRNLMSPKHWRLVYDLVRFYRGSGAMLDDVAIAQMTLGQLLEQFGAGKSFARAHILPMAAAIWSTPTQAILDFPARSFLRFFANHGLFRLSKRIAWRTVTGGSRSYVDKLAAATDAVIRTGAAVTALRRDADTLWLSAQGQDPEAYDAVVLACHADQALRLLSDADGRERAALGAFRYERNEAVLHRDTGFMPKRRRAWSSWNYLSTGPLQAPKLALSYWMNRLQALPCQDNFFVTLNAAQEPAGTIGHYDYEHPIYDMAAVAAQRTLVDMQGRRGLYFAGAHLGYGFHEDGAQSAVAVARALGAPAPWGDAAQPLDRIAA